MKIRFIVSVLMFPFILSCAGKNPQPAYLIDTTFVNFYADRMILQEEAKISNADSTIGTSRLDSLYKIYRLSQEEVDKKTGEYKQDVTKWKQLHDQVVHRLEQLQQAQPPNQQ